MNFQIANEYNMNLRWFEEPSKKLLTKFQTENLTISRNFDYWPDLSCYISFRLKCKRNVETSTHYVIFGNLKFDLMWKYLIDIEGWRCNATSLMIKVLQEFRDRLKINEILSCVLVFIQQARCKLLCSLNKFSLCHAERFSV